MKLPSESKEQIAVVIHLRDRGFFVYHIPNGMKTDAKTAARFKREGMMPGIPDLQVVLGNKQVIWIELKRRKGGVVSPAQKEVHAELEKRGHIVILAKGAKEAVEQFNQVLESLGLLSPNESLVPSHRDHLEASDKGDD